MANISTQNLKGGQKSRNFQITQYSWAIMLFDLNIVNNLIIAIVFCRPKPNSIVDSEKEWYSSQNQLNWLGLPWLYLRTQKKWYEFEYAAESEKTAAVTRTQTNGSVCKVGYAKVCCWTGEIR